MVDAILGSRTLGLLELPYYEEKPTVAWLLRGALGMLWVWSRRDTPAPDTS